MKTTTSQILVVLRILAWLAVIGYAAAIGAVFISFTISLFNPEAARDLYMGMDYYELRHSNVGLYTVFILLKIAPTALKGIVWLLVARLLSKIQLAKPFTMEVAQKFQTIAFVLAAVWAVGMMTGFYAGWVERWSNGAVLDTQSGGEYLFLAGLVYVFSQIFKRGVEMQAEGDLTV